MNREPVQPTKRGAMTKARRLRIYLRVNGRCGMCGCKVPMEGTTIDHPTQLWLGGTDADDELWFLCAPCDKPKTAKDATVRAKVKRLIREANPETRRPKKPIQSRGFDKSRTRRFDGSVVERKS